MHSRIYELKKTKEDENNLEENSIECSDMDRYGIDYVAEIDASDTAESIEWLKSCYQDTIEIDMNAGTLRFTDPKKLMESSFSEFQAALKNLSGMTIDDFVKEYPENNIMNGIGFAMWQLNKAYADHSGFYIYTENELKPLNAFVRGFVGDITEQTFYIGNVLDYHC